MGDGWCPCRRLTLSPAPACDVAGRVVSQDGSRLWQNTQLDIAVKGSALGQAQHGDVVTAGGKETGSLARPEVPSAQPRDRPSLSLVSPQDRKPVTSKKEGTQQASNLRNCDLESRIFYV